MTLLLEHTLPVRPTGAKQRRLLIVALLEGGMSDAPQAATATPSRPLSG